MRLCLMIETNWSELCSTCSSSMSAQYRSFKTSHCSTGIKVIKVSLMVYSSQFQSYLLGLRSVPAHSVLAILAIGVWIMVLSCKLHTCIRQYIHVTICTPNTVFSHADTWIIIVNFIPILWHNMGVLALWTKTTLCEVGLVARFSTGRNNASVEHGKSILCVQHCTTYFSCCILGLSQSACLWILASLTLSGRAGSVKYSKTERT